MKKVILVLALTMASSAYAKDVGNMLSNKVKGADVIDGCGLGWQVTESRTMMGTTTRGTTNMTVPASFGMTSGTMGCEKIDFAKKDQKPATFVATNFSNLKSELAEGGGDYVVGVVESFGCSNVAELSQKVQKNYSSVVASAKDAKELFYNLKKEIGTCI